MSNIEKIRQEIERRRGYISVTHFAEELLAFIDSLPEEKPSDDLEEAADEYGRENVHYWYDEEIGDGAIYDDFEDLKVGFIAGAEWQARQLLKGSPLPEDTVLFQKGVEEGRRLERDDLALTWEDVNLIDSILIDMQDEGVERYGGLRQYYEETLKRFNEQRKK